jgi:hypothetical protein
MDIAGGITLGLGRDMGYEAAYGKYVKGNQDPRPLPVDGFKNELTNNGQGADVYKHIYGIAGAVLIGDYYVGAPGLPGRAGLTGWQTVFAQVQDDRLAAAGGRLESETELRDDFAGVEVGKAMLNANKERTRPEYLQRRLFDSLCSN